MSDILISNGPAYPGSSFNQGYMYTQSALVAYYFFAEYYPTRDIYYTKTLDGGFTWSATATKISDNSNAQANTTEGFTAYAEKSTPGTAGDHVFLTWGIQPGDAISSHEALVGVGGWDAVTIAGLPVTNLTNAHLAVGQSVRIGSEWVVLTAVGASTIDVASRGDFGSTAATYAENDHLVNSFRRELMFCSFNAATDTATTPIYVPGSNLRNGRFGDAACILCTSDNTLFIFSEKSGNFSKSTDGGATWARASPNMAALNGTIHNLCPAFEATDDVYNMTPGGANASLYIDYYDRSADTWSETLISSGAGGTGYTMRSRPAQNSIRQRLSDSRIFMVVSRRNGSNQDLECWEITSATTATKKTNVYTNQPYIPAQNTISIDATLGLIAMYGGESSASNGFHPPVLYSTSSDSGTTWVAGAAQLDSSGAEINFADLNENVTAFTVGGVTSVYGQWTVVSIQVGGVIDQYYALGGYGGVLSNFLIMFP